MGRRREEKGLSVETPVSFQLDGAGTGAGTWGGVGWEGSCQHWMVGTRVLHLSQSAPPLPLTSCVTLGNSHHLSELRLPHL